MDAKQLTSRGRDVLLGILQEKTYAQIAVDLGIACETVRMHAKRLRAKLGINTKTGLALWAASNLRK